MIKIRFPKAADLKGLAVKLSLSFLASILVVLLIVSSLWLYFNFQVQKRIISEQQTITAEMAAGTVNNFIQERLNLLKSTGSLTNLVDAPKEDQNIALARILGIERSFRQVVLLDARGKELERVSRLSRGASRQLIDRMDSGIITSLKNGNNYISPIYIDEITSEPMVIMAVPVTNVLGDFQGIILSELNLKFMWDLVSAIKIGRSGYAYVVNRKGDLIAFFDISRVLAGKNLRQLKEVREFMDHDSAHHIAKAEPSRGINGNLVITTHAHLDIPDWAVIVELPLSEAYEMVIQGVFSALAAFILGALVALALGVYLSKIITGPIIKLRNATKEISKGKWDTKIEIKSKDEIGELSDSFRHMLDNLRSTTVSIEDLRKEQKRFQDVAESTGDWIWETDAQGRYVYSNSMVERIMGYKPDEIIGKHFYDFFCSTDKEDIKRVALGAFSRKEPIGGLINRSMRKDGQEVILETNGVPLIDSGGELKGYRGVDRDITERSKAEDAILRERDKAQTYLDIAGTMLLALDTEGRVTMINRKGCQILGYPKEEIVGKEWVNNFVPENNRGIVRELSRRMFAGEMEVNEYFENPVLNRSGEERMIAWRGVILRDPSGNITGHLSSGEDITERKKADEDLRRAEGLYRTLVENIDMGITLIDKDYNIVMTNAAQGKMFKKNPKDFIGYKCYSEFEKRSSPCSGCPGAETLNTGKPAEAYRQGVRDDGTLFDVRLSTVPIFNADGSSRGFIEVVEDVTERRKFEKALKESEERFRALAENSPDTIMRFDRQHRHLYVNQGAEKETGIPAGKFIGKTHRELGFPEELCVLWEDAIEKVFRSGHVHRIEFKLPSGVWIDWFMVPELGDEGEVKAVMTSARDVTAFKKVEEELKYAYQQLKEAQSRLVQSAKMASVGLLAGGVAHEINNPLTGVLNSVQLIKMITEQKKEFKMDDFKDLIDLIEESAQRCTRITRSLLGFSRASKGIYQDISLNDMVDKVGILIEHELRLQNIAFESSLTPAIPLIKADPQLIQQVVFDIITNAKWAVQKKSDNKDGKITIKTQHDPQANSVSIVISDNGVGIPRENLERIFEPFFTTKQVGEGTGLGLSIVYNIVKEHKGTITVESELDKGSIFKISFPVSG